MKYLNISFVLIALFIISCNQDAGLKSTEEELTGVSIEVKTKLIHRGLILKIPTGSMEDIW